ncbi:tyrosine-protein phosphatase [Calycomorphotria hydatis]|uniref:protein-tyrosine-phosphatase n=1 Tax=Calycomorphotria hydatis TaxID=2528027 RepID=A0A517T3C7_9PLAN|nr:CpsB/CapC family capsule biosynthesis tyrosine phosphatase [Calycomorphotria hydatis]QDT62869.1 Tyrosine-protein phosphatase CpsB [Calycomorphotria hydatis]
MALYIDIHSHLIPTLDDGCHNLEESFECIRMLKEHGFAGTVCTSHAATTEIPYITTGMIEERTELLRAELQAAGVDYQIWSGGELRFQPRTVEWLDEHGVPTLGDSRYVLCDTWSDWEPYCDDAVEYLFENGYQPILAHPERMPMWDDEWDRLLDQLQERGVLLQGNLKPIAGRDAPGSHDRAIQLLREGRYHVLALDMHRPRDLADRLAGIDIVREVVGEEQLHLLLSTRPREILGIS